MSYRSSDLSAVSREGTVSMRQRGRGREDTRDRHEVVRAEHIPANLPCSVNKSMNAMTSPISDNIIEGPVSMKIEQDP